MVTPDDIQRELELRSYESDRPPTIARILIDARDIIQSFETASSTPEIYKVRPGLLQTLDLVLAAEAHHGKYNEGQALHLHGAPSSEELLRWLALSLGEKYHENFDIPRSREAWKLYKSGALRRALNVDEAALAAFADDFETALTERLTNGRSRPATPHSVPELLEAAEHNTQAVKINPDVQDYFAHARRDTTLLSSPATEEQIEKAEARLGISLPSDYTAFLRFSNGTTGHIWGHPLGDYQPLLHSVDKLRWLDPAEEDYFTGLNLDLPARWHNWPFAPPPTAKGFGSYPEHFVIGRALEIGTEDIDNVWLLPPSTVTPIKDAVKKLLNDESLSELDKNSVRTAIVDFAGSEDEWERLEWACVTWASGGTAAMFIYPGFTAYLQDVVVKGRIEAEVQDEDEGQKMLRSGRWLGSLFGKRGQIDEQNVPEWLRDAVKTG
jgi:tetratricopeptide (TPR) repeat protein